MELIQRCSGQDYCLRPHVHGSPPPTLPPRLQVTCAPLNWKHQLFLLGFPFLSETSSGARHKFKKTVQDRPADFQSDNPPSFVMVTMPTYHDVIKVYIDVIQPGARSAHGTGSFSILTLQIQAKFGAAYSFLSLAWKQVRVIILEWSTNWSFCVVTTNHGCSNAVQQDGD